jgi:ABC-type transport system involved in cytochrome c biogenesis ATPase subunit
LQFRVVNEEPLSNRALPNSIYLIRDRWNDFGYVTQFLVIYSTTKRELRSIGRIKIAQLGMGADDQRRTDLPVLFEALDESHFSLGQDDRYYEALNRELGPAGAGEVHRALRDIAYDPSIRREVIGLDVTQTSLLRQVKPEIVRTQFERIARGGVRLSPFAFSYVNASLIGPSDADVELTFGVTPYEFPPSNVHALIGANGTGKTRILRDLARLSAGRPSEIVGELKNLRQPNARVFLRTVLISFSAFDPFTPLIREADRATLTEDGDLTYVGLYKDSGEVKSWEDLSDDFVRSLVECNQPERAQRWLATMRAFASDAQLSTAGLLLDLDAETADEAVASVGRDIFEDLSSGHKIVLLTITRLVEESAERTLVLIDEPESHLHPPLLSTFIRAVSSLLTDRNGVAIIATHSPVVLQEISRSCTWIVHRSGDQARAVRPSSETFGENVGVLTEDVFGLELTESGYHTLLQSAADEGLTYDQIVTRFEGRLGGEARSIARILSAEHRQDGGNR